MLTMDVVLPIRGERREGVARPEFPSDGRSKRERILIMINNSSLWKWQRLSQKQLDQQFIHEMVHGLQCSPFEASAMLEAVYRVYSPYFETSETPLPQSRATPPLPKRAGATEIIPQFTDLTKRKRKYPRIRDQAHDPARSRTATLQITSGVFFLPTSLSCGIIPVRNITCHCEASPHRLWAYDVRLPGKKTGRRAKWELLRRFSKPSPNAGRFVEKMIRT